MNERFEDELLRQETFGQSNFGLRCEVCCADDSWGPLRHKDGCEEITKSVKSVRDGTFTKS